MLENPVNFISLYHKCNWLNVFNIPNYWLNCTLNRNGHLCSNWLYVYIMASSHEAFLRITNEKKFWNTCTFSSCRIIMWSNTVSISWGFFYILAVILKTKKYEDFVHCTVSILTQAGNGFSQILPCKKEKIKNAATTTLLVL